MPAKIRLARHGKKRNAIYHIVVADSRAPRDGRYIEKLGLYNPNTNPATIDLDFDKALDWLLKGAQPTDTARAILSSQGVLMKKHLKGGVAKGAITEEQAEARFNEWLKSKESKISELKSNIQKKLADEEKAKLELEAKVNEERVQELAKKSSQLAAAVEAENKSEEEAEEEIAEVEEAKAEAPVEAAPEEAPVEDAKEEVVEEEKKEEASDPEEEHKAE